MAKRKKQRHARENNTVPEERKTMDKQVARKNLLKLLAVIAVTLAVFASYRLLLNTPFFFIAFPLYLALATAAILGYVIYNRGFSRRGLTPDMLPSEWSELKKRDYIEDGERRLKRSRPLLVIIVAFLFTFAVDILELYTLPLIMEALAK